MTDPEQAQRYVLDTLRDHFNHTPEALYADQVAELVELDQDTVHNALRLLYEADRIEGISVAELPDPVQVTRVVG